MQTEAGFRRDISIGAEDLILSGKAHAFLAGQVSDAERWVDDTADAYGVERELVLDRLIREVREQLALDDGHEGPPFDLNTDETEHDVWQCLDRRAAWGRCGHEADVMTHTHDRRIGAMITVKTCEAYDHRGTVRCRRPVTHRITRRDGSTVERCEGHARKYRALATVERIDNVKS